MARTYAAVEIDREVMPKGWKLVRSSSSSSFSSLELIRKLRQRGFFANFSSLQELHDACVRLSRISCAEVSSSLVEPSNQPSVCSKESSSEAQNCHTEEALVQSPPSKRVKGADYSTSKPNQLKELSLRPDTYPKAFLKNAVVENWHLSVGDGKTIPIMEVPYEGANLSCTFSFKEAWLSGFVNNELQYGTMITGWKLDLTAEGTLAIYVKRTMQVWTPLGKPEKRYEQTIRSLLVYLQLFSMTVMALDVTKSTLFQHLAAKFANWQVKPDASDLHGSLILMKKLNLGCTYPLDRRVLARVEREAATGESDAENGNEPITFKRVRRHTTRMKRQQAEQPLAGSITRLGSIKGSSQGDEEQVSCSRHSVASKETTPRLGTSELEQGEIASSSPSRSDGDHVFLGSKLHALKKIKATSQSRDDAAMLHRSLEKDDRICSESESDKEVNMASSKVDPSVGMANTLHKSEEAEGSLYCDQLGGHTNDFDFKSRVSKIFMEFQQDAQSGRKAGQKHDYQAEPFPTIKKLWDSTIVVHRALHCLERGGSLEEAQSICSRDCLSNFVANEMALRQYGVSQFAPSMAKQKEVAERINYYAHDGDTVVEISSRAVDYLSRLKERLASLGKLCSYKRVTVDHSQSQDIKERMILEGLPTGSKLLVCMSLCFALLGEQTDRIIEYVLELKPKLIVLIAPLFSRRLEEHTSYNLIWVDSELLQDEILWPWGLFDVSGTVLDKKKGVSPSLFLLSRTDWTSTHKQIASRLGHLQRPVSRG